MFIRIVIAGDKSRYQFFRNIVEKRQSDGLEDFFSERLGDKDLVVTSDKKKVGQDKNCFYSRYLPLHTELLFPREYAELSEVCEEDDRLLLFEGYPYGTEMTSEKLHHVVYAKKTKQIEVVLFKTGKDALESDISTEEMALKDAEKMYKKRKISVCQYSENEIPLFLIWENELDPGEIFQSYREKLDRARENLEYFQSMYLWEFEQSDGGEPSVKECIDFDVLAKFFAYDDDIREKNVWQFYYLKSYRYYWQNHDVIRKFCKKMYWLLIQDICIWNFETDFNELCEKMKKSYENQFQKSLPIIYKYQKNEYDGFLNDNESKILDFKNKIQNYFQCEMEKIIKQRAESKIKKMEEIVL